MARQVDKAFPPLEGNEVRVLILGSMPSQRSLERNQYYGHPQNAFWKIMQQVSGVSHEAPYEKRVQALIQNRIGVWDVIYSCHRPGSMDSDIAPDTVRINNFDCFFQRHPELRCVLFNGQAAAKMFQKHLGKSYLNSHGIVGYIMPSTSPAYAAMRIQDKCMKWLDVLEPVL